MKKPFTPTRSVKKPRKRTMWRVTMKHVRDHDIFIHRCLTHFMYEAIDAARDAAAKAAGCPGGLYVAVSCIDESKPRPGRERKKLTGAGT